jgi:hypothetical protein
MEPRHVPERRCVGCGRRAPKAALARFVAAPAGDGRRLVRDDAGRVAGRGVYVCRSRRCFDSALDRRAFARGARIGGAPLEIDGSLAERLEAERGA